MKLTHIIQTYTIPKKNALAAAEFKKLRLKYGVSQVELAEHFEVSQGTISRVERGLLDGHFEVKRFREVFRRRK